MSNKYSADSDIALRPEAAEIVRVLPADVAEAFALVAGHLDGADPAADLRAGLTHLRVAVARTPVLRVRPGESLAVSLRLASYLTGLPEGWARDALGALGVAATARADVDGRRALVAAVAAVERGLDAAVAAVERGLDAVGSSAA